VKLQDRWLDRTRTGRFWVYLGDPSHPYTVFAYTPSRRRDGPQQFLKGWSGCLQADAFGGYDGIYAGQAGGRVTEVACGAHARRKFYDARHSDAATSTQALAYIRLLYDVEDEAKEQFERQDPAAPPHSLAAIRHTLRQDKSVPRLEQFRTRLQSQQAQRGGPVLPQSPVGQAMAYALNQWDALCVYTTDGDLAIDNNVSENTLRRVAIGRNNWIVLWLRPRREHRRRPLQLHGHLPAAPGRSVCVPARRADPHRRHARQPTRRLPARPLER
jgi:transposase